VAIYHLHVKNIRRGDGRSAVAAAAYRAGETLPNEAEEKDSAFGGWLEVTFTEIRLPAGAPAWMTDRAKLWNAVEQVTRVPNACRMISARRASAKTLSPSPIIRLRAIGWHCREAGWIGWSSKGLSLLPRRATHKTFDWLLPRKR